MDYNDHINKLMDILNQTPEFETPQRKKARLKALKALINAPMSNEQISALAHLQNIIKRLEKL